MIEIRRAKSSPRGCPVTRRGLISPVESGWVARSSFRRFFCPSAIFVRALCKRRGYPNINKFRNTPRSKLRNADSALRDHADRRGSDDNRPRTLRKYKGCGGVRRRDGLPVLFHPVLSAVSILTKLRISDCTMSCLTSYCRLQLPGEIEENDLSSGAYDCEKGDFTLRFSKVNKGEHFENLEMITTLLAPPKNKSTIIPNIEVIGKLQGYNMKM